MALATYLLLAAGVVVLLACGFGLLVARGPFDALHALGPATILGVPAIVAAIAIGGHSPAITLRGALILGVGLATGPILGHATARAERLRRRGDLLVRPDDEGSAG